MKTKKVQIETIKLDPSNPRSITKEAFESLKQSITDFPEMQSVKPLVVADGYALAGNMRLLAYKDLGYRELHVLDVSEWSQAKRDEFMIKDNTHYGTWDYDALANEWDVHPLNDWGMAVWDNIDNIDTSDSFTLPDGDKAPFQQMTFTLANAQAETIKEAIKLAKNKTSENFGNENGNGNALYTIITEWVKQRK
jgi:hypothetical protein